MTDEEPPAVEEPRSDRLSRRFNLFRCVVWLVAIPVAYFLGWIYSVAFVSACSLYANAASDWAAYRADQNRDLLERLDRIERLLERSEAARGRRLRACSRDGRN